MSYSPDSLVLVASLVLLAPGEPFHAASATPAIAARAARVAACEAPVLSLPDSIELASGLQPIVRWSLQHSPRFRQQCRELAAAPRLRARVRISYHRVPGDSSRALTTFRQNRLGDIDANIEIRSAPDLTELLAHEFEHVLEQVEGVNLQTLSAQRKARRLLDGAFETARAIQVGQRVAGEVVNNSPDRMLSAGASMWRSLRRVVSDDQHVAPVVMRKE